MHRDLERETIDSGESIQPAGRVVRQGGGTYPAKRPTVVPANNEREAAQAQAA